MFPKGITPEGLNEFSINTLVSHIDIEFTEVGDDYLIAKMPVSEKTKQPMGLLHGGASVALAETLGSVAASLIVTPKGQFAVGLEINANHIKSAREGYVYGKATPLHVGRSTHLWEIRITNEAGDLVAISKITMAILDKK
ncbi:hotdog fold thioesterase [Marinoscillum luteum]|uniref:Hotdog fold thioesterase n=1 Tax=Marinoscillum luteum TaxID=861051 RepID=A0ABW7N426_9BACT